jgi:sugar/nucleoside kinase (ribokinase family)
VPDLLVVGDANPDLVLRGGDVVPAFGQREQLIDHADLTLGGSGAIMACGAAKLGLEVAIVAVVGDDELGRFTRERLRSAGVDDRHVQVAEGEATGLSVGLVREADRAILTTTGALARLDPDAVPDELLRRARHVHMSSLFLQPLLAAGAMRLIERAHEVGASTSIDTGWDPTEEWALSAEALREVGVLLPNSEEAVRLAGTAGDPRDAARALADGGPTVALKLGADGAAAFADAERVELPAPAVDAVDTTGAGDSFDAGFIAAWLDGQGLAAALALGVACGALSTRAAGGTAAQPTLAEARALT